MSLPNKYYHQIKQGVPAKDFVTAGCLFPKKQVVYDGLTSRFREMYIDCGSCINCLRDKRNSWVTRMCLHSLSWSHCYFVTLTYGSYDLNLYAAHPFKKDWLATYPSYDKYNSTGRFAWTPSILVRGHVQKFLKRLRFNTGATISYCAAGEYGGQYGRPHYHLVVWSDKALSDLDFKRAWSYQCCKTDDKYVIKSYNGQQKDFFYFRLGRVDVHDLVANGTLDWQAEFDGSPQSANHCFQYVAKYVGKSAFDNSVCYRNAYLFDRLKRVFGMLPWDFSQIDEDDLPSLIMKEKLFIRPDKKSDDIEDIDSFAYKVFTYNNFNYEQVDFNKFKRIIGPFFLCSRRYGIGKQYALQNCERFASGNYTLPKFQGRELTFPAYFARFSSFRKNPVRLRKNTPSGISLVKGSLENLHGFYSLLREDATVYYSLQEYSQHQDQIRYRPFGKSTITNCRKDGELTDISVYDREGSIVTYCYFPVLEQFTGYKFDRVTKQYYPVEFVDRVDFCDWILDLIEDNWKDLPSIESNRQMKLDLYDTIESVPNKDKLRLQYMDFKAYKQRLYELEHIDKHDYQ